MIALHSAVHNGGIALLSDTFSSLVFIGPTWIAPHVWTNLAELDRGARVIHYCVLEGRIEVSVVEEHIWIVIPPIEVPFHGLYRLDNAI